MTANLYALLQSRFPEDRTRPCFQSPDGSALSYGALEAAVARMATRLKRKGVRPGDRIAIQAPKSIDSIVIYLAALKIGAVYLPLNTAYTDHEVQYFRENAEPVLFVTDPSTLAKESVHDPLDETIHDAHTDDLAALIYTSGTTGRSKGAMLSHGNLASNGLALTKAWGFTSDDVLLHALPIFHVHGLFIALHCAFLSGSSVLWLDKFDTDQVIDALPHATVMMGVPTFYTRLLASDRFTRDTASSVRVFISGSAPLQDNTFAQFEARTGQRILERYGMSEAIIITTNPLEGVRMPGTVGYPLPDVALRIRGEAPGMIEIKGPSVFSGYWRMRDKTREEFTADGFFVTGDLGRQASDGRVSIIGRGKDLIISGGYNVYPKEVELVLDALDGVEESAVIGVPHADFGEAVVAVIAGTGEEAAIIAAAREQLAPYKTPKRVIFVDTLPRNAMGKVQKNVLRDRYADSFPDTD